MKLVVDLHSLGKVRTLQGPKQNVHVGVLNSEPFSFLEKNFNCQKSEWFFLIKIKIKMKKGVRMLTEMLKESYKLHFAIDHQFDSRAE